MARPSPVGAALVLALAACGGPAAPAQGPTTTTAAGGDGDEAAPVEAAPAGAGTPAAPAAAAPPAQAIPAELASAPAYVFRFFATGKAVTEHRLETWTLRRHGDSAMIAVERTSAPSGAAPGELGAWRPTATTVYVGTVTGNSYALSTATAKLSLECKPNKLAVASAAAVRRPHERARKPKEACSDPGRWVPEATTTVEVIDCFHPDFASPMSFGPAPGIEFVNVDDGCEQRGGGYRAIATGGAVAPVR